MGAYMIRLPYYFYLTALCFIFLTGIFFFITKPDNFIFNILNYSNAIFFTFFQAIIATFFFSFLGVPDRLAARGHAPPFEARGVSSERSFSSPAPSDDSTRRSEKQPSWHHSTACGHPRAPAASISLHIRPRRGFRSFASAASLAAPSRRRLTALFLTLSLPRARASVQVRPRGLGVQPLHEELRRRPRPASAAAREGAAGRHRPQLRDARVLPPIPRPRGRDQIPHGAEEPVRQRHHPAVPAAGGRQGLLRRAVRAHDHAAAHVQGGAHQRRRLLRRAGGRVCARRARNCTSRVVVSELRFFSSRTKRSLHTLTLASLGGSLRAPPLPLTRRSLHAGDVDELHVEHHGREGRDPRAAGRGREALGEREVPRDVQTADAPAFHGQDTLVQAGNDVGGRGVARHAHVVGLALLERVVEDEPLLVLRDVIHDNLEPRLGLHAVPDLDVLVLQAGGRRDQLRVHQRGLARRVADQLHVCLLGEAVRQRSAHVGGLHHRGERGERGPLGQRLAAGLGAAGLVRARARHDGGATRGGARGARGARGGGGAEPGGGGDGEHLTRV